MPIYEYLCPKCGLKFEALRAMSRAGEDAPCPKCGKNAGRVLSRFCHSSEGDSGGGSSCSSCSATSCSSCSSAGLG